MPTAQSTELALTEAQTEALQRLCERYKVEFDATHYRPAFDLPTGWFAGWVGGNDTTIYVGVSPEGHAHS